MAKEIDNKENLTLKKIRYYQGTIKDYETFWNEKIAEGESELSSETKSFKGRNDELNKAFSIVPVTDETESPDKDENKKVKKDKECGEKDCEEKECKKKECKDKDNDKKKEEK